MGAFQDILQRGGTIDFRVDYYDADHAKKLSAYNEADTIRALAGTTLSIPAAEFLTYCLFVDKRVGVTGIGSYDELRASLEDDLAQFNRGLIITSNSIATLLIGDQQIYHLTEKVGVAVALSLANRIHGLTEADWRPIPTGTAKTLDFDYAATLTAYVQIEAKGAAVNDNTRHKKFGEKAADITAKKDTLPAKAGKFPVSTYGTIAVLDQRSDSVLQCWLLDPPGQSPRRDPVHQRILNRLHFAAESLEVIIPKSNFVTQLYKRIAEIAEAENLDNYNQRPLDKWGSDWEQNIVASHAHTLDQKVFGVVLRLSDGSRFFYGIRREWLTVLERQDMEKLSVLEWTPETVLTPLFFRESEIEDDKRTDIAANIPESSPKKSRKLVAHVASLNTTTAGRVYGFINSLSRQNNLTIDDS